MVTMSQKLSIVFIVLAALVIAGCTGQPSGEDGTTEKPAGDGKVSAAGTPSEVVKQFFYKLAALDESAVDYLALDEMKSFQRQMENAIDAGEKPKAVLSFSVVEQRISGKVALVTIKARTSVSPEQTSSIDLRNIDRKWLIVSEFFEPGSRTALVDTKNIGVKGCTGNTITLENTGGIKFENYKFYLLSGSGSVFYGEKIFDTDTGGRVTINLLAGETKDFQIQNYEMDNSDYGLIPESELECSPSTYNEKTTTYCSYDYISPSTEPRFSIKCTVQITYTDIGADVASRIKEHLNKMKSGDISDRISVDLKKGDRIKISQIMPDATFFCDPVRNTPGINCDFYEVMLERDMTMKFMKSGETLMSVYVYT